MALFAKKKTNVPEAPNPMGMPMDMGNVSSNPLIDVVRGMKQQGLNNNQVIQELQRQGYNPQQIFDAINMTEQGNIPGGPVDQGFQMPQPDQQPMMDMSQQMQAPSYPARTDGSREKIEEMAEAIIDEKWEELVKSINKIIEWKSKVESNINKVEQEIRDLKDNFTKLQNSIIGKINEYDKNIVNVGSEVKAMSQVFEKVLPTFTENVAELRRIVKTSPKK